VEHFDRIGVPKITFDLPFKASLGKKLNKKLRAKISSKKTNLK
jgi:hypothetical protein